MFENLYTIVQEEETTYVLRIHHSHPLFEGHFPGLPILPGACMLEIVQELIALRMGHRPTIRCIKAIKFLQVISPKEDVMIKVHLEAIDTMWNATLMSADEQVLFTKIKLVCQ